MDAADLPQLRRLLRLLRLSASSPEGERRALAVFRRILGRPPRPPEDRGRPGRQYGS